MDKRAGAATVAVALALSACATTARMHSEAELDGVASECGLALGQVAQDEEEKRLLFVMGHAPSAPQKVCVRKWARRNGLKPVFIEGVEFTQ